MGGALLVAKVNSFTKNLSSVVCWLHAGPGGMSNAFGHLSRGRRVSPGQVGYFIPSVLLFLSEPVGIAGVKVVKGCYSLVLVLTG